MPFLISTPNYEYVFGPFDTRNTALSAQWRIEAIVKKYTGSPETKIEEAQFVDGWYCIKRKDGSCTKIKL